MDIAQDILKTLKSLCILLSEASVDYCLIGGLAVAILAKPRATEDIDLLILIEEQNRSSIADHIKKKFEIIQDDQVIHFKNATIWRTVLASPSGDAASFVIVDFLLADNEAYKEAVLNPVELIIDNVKIPVASPENLINIKKLAGRPQDLLDIESLREALKQQTP